MTLLPGNLLARRIAETVAWCDAHADSQNPADCLRTRVLRPANWSAAPDMSVPFDYDWQKTGEANATVVETLAERRADMLHSIGQYPEEVSLATLDLRGGRLLVMAPEDSDWCGLSEAETDGFIDLLDVPAWDTWIYYREEATTPEPEYIRCTQKALCSSYGSHYSNWQPNLAVRYLLCWVPAPFLNRTEMGIRVNPVECIFWASDYRRRHFNTETLRRLDYAGLLQ